jgi:23S rRNA pseudouridine955/2504/2580 synthase
LLKVQFVTIDEDRVGQRIDNFLLASLKGVPRSKIYRIVRKGEVRVNKGRIKPEYKLKMNDIVRIPPVITKESAEAPPVSKNLGSKLANAIVFEDDAFMVVNKPSGLAVHGGSGINLGLIEAVRQLKPEQRFLELVHRLDRDTSGLVIIAKKRSALKYFHDALRRKTMRKHYQCLVYGRWQKEIRQVNAPLLRYEKAGERMVKVDGEGKDSITKFRIAKEYKHYTLMDASPITGRTHQIRVHCLHAGCTIVGDIKYSHDEDNRQAKGDGFDRLMLHARQLEFKHPITGEPVNIFAELPENLINKMERLD